MNVGGEVTTIVEDRDRRLATGEILGGLVNTRAFLLGPAPPGEDKNASNGDGSGGMVLSGEDVLRRGSDLRPPTNGHIKGKRTREDQVTSAPRAVRVPLGQRFESPCAGIYQCENPDLHSDIRMVWLRSALPRLMVGEIASGNDAERDVRPGKKARVG